MWPLQSKTLQLSLRSSHSEKFSKKGFCQMQPLKISGLHISLISFKNYPDRVCFFFKDEGCKTETLRKGQTFTRYTSKFFKAMVVSTLMREFSEFFKNDITQMPKKISFGDCLPCFLWLLIFKHNLTWLTQRIMVE